MTPPKERITQLERDAMLVRERVLGEIEGSDEGWALDRLLSAYEQEKARADEAERDTAQASEARLREAADCVLAAINWSGHLSISYEGDADDVEAFEEAMHELHAALTSTPDPEEDR